MHSMTYRAPNPFATLVEYHTRRGSDDAPPSPNDSVGESSRRSYSPSFYSKADHISEFRFQPNGEHEEMPPFPDYLRREHLRESDTSDPEDDGTHDEQGRTSYIIMDPEDDAALTRLSVMGPKMKLLSRAPWEDGAEDEIREVDEITDDGADNVSVFGKRSRERSNTVTKGHEDARGWKGFGLSVSKSKDAVPPVGLRSISSPISIPEPPESSVSWDGRPLPSQKQPTSRLGIARPRTVSSSNSSMSRTHSFASSFASSSSISSGAPPLPSPLSDRFPLSPPSPTRSVQRTRKIREKSPAPATSSNGHPYANPEICPPTTSLPYPSPHSANYFRAHPTQQHDIPTSDSKYPRSESSTTIKSSSAANVLAPSTTYTSLATASATVAPSASGKQQSLTAPSTPVINSDDIDGVPAGMLGFPGSPAYNLITLEQAREKVRERSKSGTLALPVKIAAAMSDETVSEQRKGILHPSSIPNDPPPSMSALSSSTDHAIDGDSPPLPPLPGARTVKPKRSGFLKFFKDGKEKDKEHVGAGFEVPTVTRSYSGDFSSIHHSNENSISSVSFPPPLPSVPQQYRVDSKEIMSQPGSRSTTSGRRAISFSSQVPPTNGVTKSDQTEPKPKKSPKLGSKAARAAKLEASAAKSRETGFESLQIRPVSSFFSSGLPMDLLSSPGKNQKDGSPGLGITIPEGTSLESHDFAPATSSSHSLSVSSATTSSAPLTPASEQPLPLPLPYSGRPLGSATSMSSLGSFGSNPQLTEARKAWRIQAWEYEAQIRDLQAEVAMLRARECEKCGAAPPPPPVTQIPQISSILDRPRRKTGAGSRFAGGWEGAD